MFCLLLVAMLDSLLKYPQRLRVSFVWMLESFGGILQEYWFVFLWLNRWFGELQIFPLRQRVLHLLVGSSKCPPLHHILNWWPLWQFLLDGRRLVILWCCQLFLEISIRRSTATLVSPVTAGRSSKTCVRSSYARNMASVAATAGCVIYVCLKNSLSYTHTVCLGPNCMVPVVFPWILKVVKLPSV